MSLKVYRLLYAVRKQPSIPSEYSWKKMDVKLTMMTMMMIVQDKLTTSLFLAKVRNNRENCCRAPS